MKKETLLVLFLVLLLPCVIYGSLNSFSSLDKDKTDPIDLIGKIEPPDEIRSVKMPPNITIEKQGNVILVMFQEAWGNIQISITNEMGEEVYLQKVDPKLQSQLSIPLLGLPNGSYTIIIDNYRGTMHGDFKM